MSADEIVHRDDDGQLLTAVREGEIHISILAPAGASLDDLETAIDETHKEAEHTVRHNGGGR